MPELPEVQTVVNDLNKKILNQKIVDVWCDWPNMIKNSSFPEFKKKIRGLKIKIIKRRGKNILIYLEDGHRSDIKGQMSLLLIHLKMTGHLLVGQWKIEKSKVKSLSPGLLEEKVNGYIHLIFYLDDGSMMGFSDLRKFAKVLLGTEEEIKILGNLNKLGPEPLAKDFDLKKFKSLISNEKRKIKQVLLDQEVIVGMGNIYADEILWATKIHPQRVASELKDQELAKMYSNMRAIFVEAIKFRGTSTSDFRHPSGQPGSYAKMLKVYQREGEGCYRCRALIQRIKIGSRSAHFCPQCQI